MNPDLVSESPLKHPGTRNHPCEISDWRSERKTFKTNYVGDHNRKSKENRIEIQV